MNDEDVHGGQLDAGIVFRYARIIPLGDFAEVDVGQNVGPNMQVVDALDVEDRDNGSQHGGNSLNLHFRGGQLFVRHGNVAGAKVDCAGCNLTYAPTAADRLVVDGDPWMGSHIFAKP